MGPQEIIILINYFKSLKKKKAILTDLLGVRAQGALVRSRFQNISEMDVPSRFFFGLERKNGQSRLIHCLKSNDGKEITKMLDIRRRAVDFYEELYASEHEENDLLAKHFYKDLPQVPEEFYEELMKPLSKEELYASLQSLKNGKAPGIDGLPVDFYKAYWDFLGDDLLEVLNNSLNGGQLPQSCSFNPAPKKRQFKGNQKLETSVIIMC